MTPKQKSIASLALIVFLGEKFIMGRSNAASLSITATIAGLAYILLPGHNEASE